MGFFKLFVIIRSPSRDDTVYFIEWSLGVEYWSGVLDANF